MHFRVSYGENTNEDPVALGIVDLNFTSKKHHTISMAGKLASAFVQTRVVD
jgi:hypothetical protein